MYGVCALRTCLSYGCRYRKFCTIARKPGSGRPTKITSHVKQIVEQRMRQDNETTASQLHELLTHNGISSCLRTILRCREQLGWTFRGSAYREGNKQKRLGWALQYQTGCVENVIYSAEADWNIPIALLQKERRKAQA